MDYTLYFIPGIATDKRVYEKLDLPEFKKVYLEWETPGMSEIINEYASRMASKIDPKSNPVLVGYSFGGMIAIEIAKIIHVEAVILVSSIKDYRERSFSHMFTSGLGLHKFLPTTIGKEMRFAYAWMNDPQSAEEHAFIDLMKEDLNEKHTDWAIDQAMKWRHTHALDRVYHIHGEKDRIFPIRYIENCIKIKGGTHLMLLNKGEEIAGHIRSIVHQLEQERGHKAG